MNIFAIIMHTNKIKVLISHYKLICLFTFDIIKQYTIIKDFKVKLISFFTGQINVFILKFQNITAIIIFSEYIRNVNFKLFLNTIYMFKQSFPTSDQKKIKI